MKYNIKLISFLTIVLIVLIHKGYAIRCFECRSDADPKCADPFDNRTVGLSECHPRLLNPDLPLQIPKMCRKIRQKIHGAWRYIRGCAILGEVGIRGDERFCLMRTGTYNIFMEYCTCNSRDGCNNSPTIQLSSTLSGTLFVILMVKLLYFYR